MLVLSLGGQALAWGSVVLLGLAALAVALTAAFLRRERRAPDPLVPLAMLAHPTVRIAAAGLFLVTAALFAAVVFIPGAAAGVSRADTDRGRAAARDDDRRADRVDHARRTARRPHRPAASPAGDRCHVLYCRKLFGPTHARQRCRLHRQRSSNRLQPCLPAILITRS